MPKLVRYLETIYRQVSRHQTILSVRETLAIMNVGNLVMGLTEVFMSSSSDESVIASTPEEGIFGLSFLSESGLGTRLAFITVWGCWGLLLFVSLGVFLKKESIFCCLFIPISI